MSDAQSANSNGKEKALKSSVKYDVPADLMQQCLNTSLYELTRKHPFVGSTLQIMNISYTYMVPTAGVSFNADSRKFEMKINPFYFCRALDAKQRVAVLIHEMYHILNQHLIRIPFMKLNDSKRMLLNVAGDLSINQTITDLPRGCSECPPIEEQKNGSSCKNELCPGFCLDISDYYDLVNKNGSDVKVFWPKNRPMEWYFEKLLEQYSDVDEEKQNNNKNIMVSIATLENLDTTPNGQKRNKTLTFNTPGHQSIDGRQLLKKQNVLVKDQNDQLHNGIYVVTDEGNDTQPVVLTRLEAHDGSDQDSLVKVGDACVPRYGSLSGKLFVVDGGKQEQVVDVDVEPIIWSESKQDSNSKGKGYPRQFDVHDWHANAEESDILDATEDLVKRSLVKQSMGYDDLPSSVKELLDYIKSRKEELNYKSLILSAIKRSASGHDRDSTWNRRSRRFGNKAPGTKEGNLPKLSLYLDTSGSISIEELSTFLDVVDQFLKVGARKCEINLFSDSNYYTSKYKLGDRSIKENIQKSVQMGGTDLSSSLKRVADTKSDLSIFITDGFYPDVNAEQWIRPGGKFPQTLFIISKDGSEDHPLKRLGKTIKIPK